MTSPSIFILGNHGFLGKNVVDSLLYLNLNLVGISRTEISLHVNGAHQVYPLTIEKVRSLVKDFSGDRILINCVRENASISRPKYYELLETLAPGSSMVINFSTYIQYYELSQSSQLVSYRHNQHQQSLFLESITQNTRFIDIALFTLFGPGDSPNSFLCSFFERAKTNEPLDLSGLQQLVSYTWVKDVVRMVHEIVFQLQQIEGRFSFWPEPPKKLSEIVELVVEQSKTKSEIFLGRIPYKGHELFNYDEGIFPPQIIKGFAWTSLQDGLLELFFSN